jgi:hypothetical protein
MKSIPEIPARIIIHLRAENRMGVGSEVRKGIRTRIG